MTTNLIIKEDLEFIYNSNINWSSFYNSTILITGANGFLPAYIVESLLYVGYKNPNCNIKVIGLVRNIINANIRFKDYLNYSNLKFIEQDVCESILLNENIDYVIHAASQASPKFYGIDPVGTLSANVIGTINMLNFSKQKNVKSFLFFSSSEVYGELSSIQMPAKEDFFGHINPTNVRSCYAESKKMGENICVSFYHQFGVPVKMVRPFHTYGPGMKLDDGRVYADFVADVLNNKDICMLSEGTAKRAFCYLTDATIGFLKVLIDGKDGEAYNIGNTKEEYSILELAETIVNIFPEKNIKVKKLVKEKNNNYLPSSVNRNLPDISKMKANLNWEPVYDVITGFKRTIESYNETN